MRLMRARRREVSVVCQSLSDDSDVSQSLTLFRFILQVVLNYVSWYDVNSISLIEEWILCKKEKTQDLHLFQKCRNLPANT